MVDQNSISHQRRLGSIVALNAVSILAQFGQYGLGTTLIPIGLKARNAGAESIGVASSALWCGMLVGLLIAGQLTRTLGYRTTLIVGILLSALSFILMPLVDWQLWAIPAAIIGFGLGLRWIALETWLYRIIPTKAQGRIIGIHESLLATAAFLGPLMMVTMDPLKPDAFWLAAAVMLFGFVPLCFAQTIPAHSLEETTANALKVRPNLKFNLRQKWQYWLGFGAVVAGLGGYVEGSLLAFIPVYTADIGFTAADAAWLLTIFQIGAMAFQFPVGWMADHYGLLKTTKACAVIAFAGLLSAVAFGAQLPILTITTFMLGGSIASTLSLGLIWAVHNNAGAIITNKVKQVSVTYTALSATGPLITGFVINGSSSNTLFWQQLILVLVLVVFLLCQKKTEQKSG